MAFASLFSRPPGSALLTECQHAGEPRTEAELEDGEIEDGGVEEEPEPEEEKKEEAKEEEEKNSSEKSHKKSRKRKKKEREKKKRRRREKHKHSDSSDSYDSDAEHSERPHKPPMYRDYDSHYSQRGHYSSHKKSRPGFDNYSDGNYNEEEDEDYAEQLKHYRQSKESSGMEDPPYKKGMKGVESGGEQQQKDYFYGRGAGPHKKMMMRKGRGRGRGGHKGSYYQDGYQDEHKPKKWVAMSQEFINQHTVERNGKQICKYFLERRCVKGDQCKFDHDAEIEKKKEICKFYIQGFCTRGDNCIYMHNEFPCKFFHTGAKCYQGDKCKFSHEPLTDDSQELLNKVLNTEEEKLQEEEECEEMSHHGGNYYNQPYMGMPFTSMYNSEPIPEPEPMMSPPLPMPMYGNQGMNAPYNQPAMPGHGPNQQRDGPPGPPYLQSGEENVHGMPLQNSYQHSQNAPGFYDNYYSQQAVHHPPASNISESVRKVLFSRLGKAMDGSEISQPPAAPPQRSGSREEDEFANWYSSEEEDGVSSILKTLRNQAKLARTNSTEQKPTSQISDPRLAKDRPGGGQVFDPRVRPSQGQSPGHQGENVPSDPRVARDPRKVKPSGPPAVSQPGGSSGAKQQKVVDEDDEDAERELRDKAAAIPLEMLPGVTLRDPRLKLRQFSHIKKDIILAKPNFAKLIVWAPEDLLPVPPPKQDPVSSINLPLPPLIADQRMKAKGLGDLHHSGHDPRLERLDPRLESKTKLGNLAIRSSFGDSSDPYKPSDPRLQKSLQPRFHRSPSSDSQPGGIRDPLSPKLDPRLVGRSPMGSPTSVKPPQDLLLPLAPKVSPSSSRLGTPGSILKSISLFNPRDSAATASEPSPTRTEQNGDHHKKNADDQKPELDAMDSVPKPMSPPLEQPKAKDTESTNDSDVKPKDPDEKQEATEAPPVTQPSAAPALHNLPIQALSGLIRPQYSDPRQVKPGPGSGSGPAPTSQAASDTTPEGKSEDDKPLRDVFKTFDPTASPFGAN